MDAAEFAREERRLQLTLDEVSRQLETSLSQAASAGESLLAARRLVWDEVAHRPPGDNKGDAASLQAEVRKYESLEGLSVRKVATLRRALDKPYFARIDWVERGEKPVSLYLGMTGVRKPSDVEPIVYDWRAPVSSLFYEGEVGPAEYVCEAGVIAGEVTRKRQYAIGGGRLESYFDSTLKVDDEVLRQALVRFADTHMREIVATIQRDQNRAIRDTLHRLLLVEGPAGSGKTSIALHRVAYLLYQYKEALTADNVLIFSPNRLFSDYISRVLPDLGEENAQVTTFDDYVRALMGDNGCEIEVESAAGQLDRIRRTPSETALNLSRLDWLGSDECIRALEAFAVRYSSERVLAEDVVAVDEMIMDRAEMAQLLARPLAGLPLASRLRQIESRIQPKLSIVEKRRRKAIFESIKDEVQEVMLQSELTSACRDRLTQELAPVRAQIARLLTVDPLHAYERFLDILPAEVSRESREGLSAGLVLYEDAAPLVYLMGLLYGFPNSRSILHVVIDEAQDYTPMQYSFLARLFVGRSITILGDSGQMLAPLSGERSSQTSLGWVIERLESELSLERKDVGHVVLERSYRSTAQINAFANAILGRNTCVEDLGREGTRPVVEATTPEELPSRITAVASEFLKRGAKSIGIICRDSRTADSLHRSLPMRHKILTGSGAEGDISSRCEVTVMPIFWCKGLEFDAVIIPDANVASYDSGDAKLLYTACTRALHWLHVLYIGPMTPLLLEVAPQLWETM